MIIAAAIPITNDFPRQPKRLLSARLLRPICCDIGMELLWGIRQVSHCKIINNDVLVCSCRVSKVGHDPFFWGCVHKLDHVELCISQVCVSTCEVFSIWSRLRNDTLRFGTAAVSWERLPVRWIIFSPSYIGGDMTSAGLGRSSPIPVPNPRQILHWDHVLSCFVIGETAKLEPQALSLD